MNRYFFISALAPIGPCQIMWKGVRHPLHKAELDVLKANLARQCTMIARGQMIPPEAVSILATIEVDADSGESWYQAAQPQEPPSMVQAPSGVVEP